MLLEFHLNDRFALFRVFLDNDVLSAKDVFGSLSMDINVCTQKLY